jgi:ABC-type phosphate transport system substrate-binding protein
VRALAIEGVLPTPDTLTAAQYPIRAPVQFVGLSAPGDDAYRAFFAWVQSPAGQAVVRLHYGGLPTQ